MLAETASAMHEIVNEDLAEKIHKCCDEPGIVSNGGDSEIAEVAKMGSMLDPMSFSKNGIANLMSASKLIYQGFRAHMDSAAEPVVRVEKKN